jgi:hypothetical protein
MVALVRSATSTLVWGRLRAVVGVAILLASTLAGAKEVLQRFDVINPSILQNLNPIRLLQPLLDRFFNAPQLTASADPLPSRDLVIPTLSPNASIGEWHPAVDFGLAPALPAGLTMPEPSRHSTSAAFNLPIELATMQPVAPTFPLHGAEPYSIAPPAENQPLTPVHTAAMATATAAAAPASASMTAQPPATLKPLIIDRASFAAGDSATVMDGGTQLVSFMIVGDLANGHFVQRRGDLHATEAVVVANQPGSVGTYTLENGTLQAPNMTVAKSGNGTFEQSGGKVDITPAAAARPTVASATGTPSATPAPSGKLTIGDMPGSSGVYSLKGGELDAVTMVIGNNGKGLLQQDGGTATFQNAVIGVGPTGDGQWVVNNGSVKVATSTAAPAPTSVVVGGDGIGTFNIRSSSGANSPTIAEQPGTTGTTVVVRSSTDGQGIFRGHGIVKLTGPLVENGKVIADGSGQSRSLDFSAVAAVTNTIENSPNGGNNGWFARQGGTLILPTIKITSQQPSTWGEDPSDPVIDLVNSVRITPHGMDSNGGSANIELHDPKGVDVPQLPDGIDVLSVWSLESSASFSSLDVTVRYDDVRAALSGMGERDLALWAFSNGAWSPIADASSGQDLANHLLSGTAPGLTTWFAVGTVPEPSVVGLGLLAAGGLLMRRRRRRTV